MWQPLRTGGIASDVYQGVRTHHAVRPCIPPYYTLLGPRIAQEIETELVRVSRFERVIWLVIKGWAASTAELNGPETLGDVQRRIANGVARILALVDAAALAAMKEARAKNSTVRVAARVHAQDVQFLLDGLVSVAKVLGDNSIRAVATIYVGRIAVEPLVLTFRGNVWV